MMIPSRSFEGFGSIGWLTGLILLAALLLPGCGGGGGGSSAAQPLTANSAPEEGELLVGITDAEGDFLDYSVDVHSLKLIRANGDVVETLPLTTRIDFTELTEVTELLTLATVPAGIYETVSMTLDFSTAEVVVQDDNGDAVEARLLDDSGAAPGITEVRLRLSGSDVIRIAPGVPAAFSLDFDLDASNEIDLSVVPAVVTVEPWLLATPELEQDRAHRARGLLAAVDTAANAVTLKIRPFRHRTGEFGRLQFSVDASTEYEIDGVSWSGSDGLRAMSALNADTPVIAGLTVDAGTLTAHTVLAGSSVPWADQDVIHGVVTARAGTTLTVSGARIEFGDGHSAFSRELTVEIGVDTAVTQLTVDGPLGIEHISVGSRMTAFGEFVDERTLDASDGRVRLRFNQITGTVAQVDPLALRLFYLNGRRPGAFDFSGTGVTGDSDADPDFYEIDTAALGLTDIDDDDLLRVRGYVSEFGSAAPDYDAQTVIQIETDMRGADLTVFWPEASAMPFSNVSTEQLELDLSEARAFLKQRGVPHAFNNPLERLALQAPADGRGVYGVAIRGEAEVRLFRDFASMSAALVETLDAGHRLKRIGAHGRYNTSDGVLTTGRALFVFQPAALE